MENDKIQDWGNTYEETPKEAVWGKITERLDNNPSATNRKVFTFNWKHYAIAANVVIILAVMIGFSGYFDVDKKQSFTYNINQKPVKMEEVNIEITSDFYSIDRISVLSKAYETGLNNKSF